jgi:hypothetical protein
MLRKGIGSQICGLHRKEDIVTTAQPGQEPRPTQEELEAMMPNVLELQRLFMDRMRRALRPRDEFAVVSCTSCDNQSCN